MRSKIGLFFFRPIVKKSFGSFFTQAILSATSFLVGVILIKNTSKEQYGLYVVAFATILFFNGIQNALVNVQLMVHHPHHDENKRKLIAGFSVGQWLVFVPVVFIFMSIVYLFRSKISFQVTGGELFILALVILLSIAREFVRTVHFCKLEIKNVIKMDSIYVFVVAILILGMALWFKVSAVSAVLILGVGYLISSVNGCPTKGNIKIRGIDQCKYSFSETWKQSKWALIGCVLVFLQNHGYVYVVSAIKHLQGTADISASRLLMMPVSLSIGAIGKIYLPKGAKVLKDSGTKKLMWLAFSVTVVIFCVFIVYVMFLVAFHRLIIKTVLAREYLNISNYLFLWGILFGVRILRSIVNFTLQIYKDFKWGTLSIAVSSIVTLVLCKVLLVSMGLSGGIVALITGELVLSVALGYHLIRNVKEYVPD